MDSGNRMMLVSDMPDKVRSSPGLATLWICAGFRGDADDVHGFCAWAAPILTGATGESWGPSRVCYWLQRECRGSGWVRNNSIELTVAGRVELRCLRGEMPFEDAAIWLEAAA